MGRLVVAVCLFLITSLSFASKCDLVVITGDPNWPPYSIEREGQLKGLGPHLAKVLLAELGLPSTEIHADTMQEALEWLERGKADLLVSTYHRRNWRRDIDYVYPPYSEDGATIVLRHDSNIDLNHWDDLLGEIGLTTVGYPFNKNFQKVAARYLFIKPESTNEDILKLLHNGSVDYGIGSRNGILMAIHELGLDDEFNLMPKYIDSDPVYFAFSKNTACRDYEPYFRMRIHQMITDGSIDKILERYIPNYSRYNNTEEGSQTQPQPQTQAVEAMG